jgi:ArsR family metal-binding transcriptional regulator
MMKSPGLAGPSDELVRDYELELLSPPCRPGAESWSARAALHADISEALPFLNAQLKGADYEDGTKVLIWKDRGRSFAFRAQEIKAGPVRDREGARRLIDEAVGLVNETWKRRAGIAPSFANKTLPNLMILYRLLPRTNCCRCGCSTCMAFAAALREGDAQLQHCPVLEEPRHAQNRARLAEMLGCS